MCVFVSSVDLSCFRTSDFFQSGAPALVKTVGEDLTSAGDMIRDRQKKRLKMGIAVTIFRFFIAGKQATAASAGWSLIAS